MPRLAFVNQYAEDLPEMKAFYEEVLGLVSSAPSETWHGYGVSNVEFALEPRKNREANEARFRANWSNPYLLQFVVEDDDEMHAIIQRAKAKNVKVLTECEATEYGTLTKLLDPQRNLVELIILPTANPTES